MKLFILVGGVFFSSLLALANESTVKVNGYIDAQGQWGHGLLELQPGTYYGGDPGFGFSIHKGAFEFQHDRGKHQMHIDIPFHQTRTTPTSSNDLDLAKERAQAYISGQPEEGWSWKLGQFDTPWGYEGNDTNTIIFRNLGIVYNVTPNTNLGLMITRHYTPFIEVLMFLGNSNQTAKQSVDKELEMGVQLAMQMGEHFFKAGVLFNQRKGKYTVGGANSYDYEQGALVDLQLGHNVFQRLIVLNAIYVHPDNKKVQHNGVEDDTDPTWGGMLQIPLYTSELVEWSLRGEYLKNDRSNAFVQAVSASGNESELIKVSLGRKVPLDEGLHFKTTIDYFKVNVGENGKDNHWLEGAIAGVYEF